jgi:hypothetical protein
MNLRQLVPVVVVCLLVAGVVYAWTWTDPERGLERRWGRLLKAMEARDWERFQAFLAADYRDGFGYDREQLVRFAQPVFQRFVRISISRRGSVVEVDGDRGVTRARIIISGNGDAFAQQIMRGSRMLETPTEFIWRRTGRPWEWELVSLRNPSVDEHVRTVERELGRLPF